MGVYIKNPFFCSYFLTLSPLCPLFILLDCSILFHIMNSRACLVSFLLLFLCLLPFFSSSSTPSPSSSSSSSSFSSDLYSLKPELSHTFGPVASRPFFFFPLFFSFIVISLLLGLVYKLLVLKYVELDFSTDLVSSSLFLLSIGSILFLYFLYWIQFNIFQTFSVLSVLMFITLLTGNAALRSSHKRRAANTKSE